ncbi:MAG TPA: glycosyltransferase [Acidimicrobiales bacterium]
MPEPVRVLLVVAHGGTGGMQVQVGLLARGLAAAGCEVAVAAGPGPLETDAVPRHELPALSASSAPRVAHALRRVIADVQPDVVHAHGLRLAPVLAAAARRRALVTCHGVDPVRARRTAAMVRLTRVPVASCGEGPRRLLASSGLRSRVLNNAVPDLPEPIGRLELASTFGLDPSTFLSIAPARLSPQKDPLTLVRAVAHAPGVSAVLVGGGPLEPDAHREVALLGLETRVVVAPWRDDARRLLAGADALCLSSTWEGQPTVVLEAMSAGIPVVATACVGTSDTVVDGRTGLLAPVGDHVALGAALARVARDAGLREGLVTAARVSVAAHALDVVVAAHLDAYDRLLHGGWL